MEPLSLDPPYLVIRPGVSEEEYYRLAEGESGWEYLDGRLVMHSPMAPEHEDLLWFLLTLIGLWLEEKGGARVLGPRFPMRLDERWSPEPALLVVKEEGYSRLTPRRLDGPPHLVVEVASESDPGLARREKLPRYREASIDEIWLVDPFARRLQAETRRGIRRYQSRTVGAGHFHSSTLPGFWIDAAWLWQGGQRPSPGACLEEILGET